MPKLTTTGAVWAVKCEAASIAAVSYVQSFRCNLVHVGAVAVD